MRRHLLLVLGLQACLVPESMVDRLLDADGDGQRTEVVGGDDCDDANPDVRTGIAEICGNGVDDDCDGRTDDAGLGAVSGYRDADQDGFGDHDQPIVACILPADAAILGGDCDDTRADVHPSAFEDCRNGRDDDCDGAIDNSLNLAPYYPDRDGDLRGGSLDAAVLDCSPPEGHVAVRGDCDDLDADVHEGATERPYDGIDQDCDGKDDFDLDNDGVLVDPRFAPFPIADASYLPQGPVDCDDLDASVWPGATDPPYDGKDGNCDGSDDFDADGDGYRSADHGGDDCNDRDDDIHPGADEVPYDGVDDDCDPTNDDDVDGDGHAALARGGTDCDDLDPNNWVSCPTCQDRDKDGRYTGCDAYLTLPSDCDDTDAGVWASCATCRDADQDGYATGCDAYPLGPQDCDDTNPDVFRSCGGCKDADGDGWWSGCDAYVLHPADCDDTLANAWTTCADCTDADGDRWGVGASCQAARDCDDAEPDAWVSCATCMDGDDDGSRSGCDRYTTTPVDCDDADPDVDGTALEILDDGIDQDCDGRDLEVTEEHGLFVSGTGVDDLLCGTRDLPCRSLELAAPRAFDEGKVLFAAEGTYGRFDTRVSVFGGFDPVTWAQDPDRWVTEIVASEGSGIGVGGGKVDLVGVRVVDGGPSETVSLIRTSARWVNVTQSMILNSHSSIRCRALLLEGASSANITSSKLDCNGFEESYGVVALTPGEPPGRITVSNSSVQTIGSQSARSVGIQSPFHHISIRNSSILTVCGAVPAAIVALGDSTTEVELFATSLEVDGSCTDGARGVYIEGAKSVSVNRVSVLAKAEKWVRAYWADLAPGRAAAHHQLANSIILASASEAPTSIDCNSRSDSPLTVDVKNTTLIVDGSPVGVGVSANATCRVSIGNTIHESPIAFSGQPDSLSITASILGGPCATPPLPGTGCTPEDFDYFASCTWQGCSAVDGVLLAPAQLDPTSEFGATPLRSSPAIGAALVLPETDFPPEDFYGSQRPPTGPWDIGAVQVSHSP